ncbi:MAG: hypothetical protein WCR71_07320 [Bacteroidales bacterium]
MESFYLIFDKEDREEKNLQVTGNRAVGVVYNSRRDSRQFIPTIIPLRYDALFFFKKNHCFASSQEPIDRFELTRCRLVK